MKKRCCFPYGLAVGLIVILAGQLFLILRAIRFSRPTVQPQDEPLKDFLVPDTDADVPAEFTKFTPDDLTRLHGIGEKTAQVLAQVGIVTYVQLAKVSAEDLKTLLVEAGNRITNPATWPEQAALAARGDWDGLQKFIENSAAANPEA